MKNITVLRWANYSAWWATAVGGLLQWVGYCSGWATAVGGLLSLGS